MKIFISIIILIFITIILSFVMIKLLNKQYDKTKIPKEALKVIESMKNPQYSENELKWDKMIDLWVNNELDDPIKYLITYDSEVQNGGHLQFFENCHEDLKIINTYLKKTLSNDMYNNFKKAYDLYKKANIKINNVEDYVDEALEERFIEADDFYYSNEEEITKILKKYSSTIEL